MNEHPPTDETPEPDPIDGAAPGFATEEPSAAASTDETPYNEPTELIDTNVTTGLADAPTGLTDTDVPTLLSEPTEEVVTTFGAEETPAATSADEALTDEPVEGVASGQAEEAQQAVDEFTEEDLLAAASTDAALTGESAEITGTTASAAGPNEYEPASVDAGVAGAVAASSAADLNDAGVPPLPPSDPPPVPPIPPVAPPGATPPPYNPGPPIRRLYRSRDDRKLGGVSAGIAEYFRLDPTWVRLGTLVAFMTGVGGLMYVAAWIVVPMRPEGMPAYAANPPSPAERNVGVAAGIAALALAVGIATGSWTFFALALVGGGIWLLSEHTVIIPPLGSRSAYEPAPVAHAGAAYAPAQPAPPRPAPQPASAHPGYAQPAYAPAAPSWTPPEPKPPRQRQRVTWLVLSLLALLAAVGLAASAGDWWDVSATRLVGIGVVIIGAGVVAGQIRGGGARGLIPLGILSALLLFPVSAVDGLVDEGIGESVYRPASIEELQSSYRHGVGELTVDLSAVDFTGRNERIDVDLGIGDLTVIVPRNVGGRAELDTKAGELSYQVDRDNTYYFDGGFSPDPGIVQLDGTGGPSVVNITEDGLNVETGTIRFDGDTGTIDLNIHVGLGVAQLRLAGEAE